MTASHFIQQLRNHRSDTEKQKLQRFFRGEDGSTDALGVTFGTVFKTAKEYMAMPLVEIEKWLREIERLGEKWR